MRKIYLSIAFIVSVALLSLGVISLRAQAADNNASPVDFTYFFNTGGSQADALDVLPDSVGLPSSNLSVYYSGKTYTVASPTYTATAFNSRQRCNSSLVFQTPLSTISGYSHYTLPLDGDEICWKVTGSGTEGSNTREIEVYVQSYTPSNNFTKAISQDGALIRFRSVGGFSQYQINTTLQSANIQCNSSNFSDSQLVSNNTYDLGTDYSDTNDGSWLCLRARRYSGSGYRYAYFAWRIDTTSPVIVFDQFSTYTVPAPQRRITAKVDASYTENDIDETTWQYVGPTETSLSTCGKTQFENSSGRRLSSVKTGKQVAVNESHNTQWLCFRVADTYGNWGYTTGADNQLTGIDLTGPTIDNFRQVFVDSQQQLVFSLLNYDSSFGGNGYKYLIITSGQCAVNPPSNALNGLNGSVADPEVTMGVTALSGLKDGNKVCVWSQDALMNMSSAQLQVDLQAPNISQKTLQYSSGAGSTVLLDHFKTSTLDQVFYTLSVSDPGSTCTAGSGVITNGQTAAIGTNRYICLAVADQYGNRSTRRLVLKVPNTALPAVRASQHNNTVQADQIGSITGNSWRVNRNAASLQECRNKPVETFNKAYESYTASQALTVTSSENGKIYCFINKAGNNYASDGVKIDLTAPTLIVWQVALNYMEAQSNDPQLNASSWYGAKLAAGTSCNSTTVASTSRGAYQRVTISTGDHGKKVCFSVQDTFGNAAFVTGTISLQGSLASITQSNNKVVVQSDSTTDKIYYSLKKGQITSNQACQNLTYRQITSNKTVTLNESHSQAYYICIKVVDTAQNTTYSYLNISQVDTTAPQVTATKNNDGTQVMASDNDTAINTWQYKILNSGETCRRTIPTGGVYPYTEGSSVDVSSANRGSTYCFWSTDRFGNTGYGQVIVSLTTLTPSISLEQIGRDRLEASSSSTQATIEWHYSDNPNCINSTSTPLTGWSSGNSVTLPINTVHGQVYCFWAKFVNSSRYSFATIRVDRQAPINLIVTQANNGSLTASAQDSSPIRFSYTQGVLVAPNCDNTNLNYLAGATQTGLSAADNGKYVCFRAVDAYNNTAYKLHQILGLTNEDPEPPDDGTQNQIDALVRLIQQLIAQIIQLLNRSV